MSAFPAFNIKYVTAFYNKADRTEPNGCWPWRGSLNGNRYANFVVNGRQVSGHRFAWMLANGPIPSGMHVMHTCDRRDCVAPHHVRVGSRSDNVRDMVAKGRQGKGFTRLTYQEVYEIRYLALSGWTQTAIAEAYERSVPTIHEVIQFKSYMDIHLFVSLDLPAANTDQENPAEEAATKVA